MSTDMRLLILTHLRDGLERKWASSFQRAALLAEQNGDTGLARRIRDALRAGGLSRKRLEAVYVSLGGMGSGEPAKRPETTEKARDGACGGVAA